MLFIVVLFMFIVKKINIIYIVIENHRYYYNFSIIFQGRDGQPGMEGPPGEKGDSAFIPQNYNVNLKGEPGPRGEPGR